MVKPHSFTRKLGQGSVLASRPILPSRGMVYSHASRKMLHSILSVKVPKLLTYFVSEPRWIEPSYGKVHRIGGNARLVYSQNSQRHAPPYSLSAHMSENPISADQFSILIQEHCLFPSWLAFLLSLQTKMTSNFPKRSFYTSKPRSDSSRKDPRRCSACNRVSTECLCPVATGIRKVRSKTNSETKGLQSWRYLPNDGCSLTNGSDNTK